MGLTLIELIVAVAIILIIASIATVNYLSAQTRAKVAATQGQLHTLAGAIDLYRMDHGSFPAPGEPDPGDPMGVLASSALRGLTTPVAYVDRQAFHDPFGELRVQTMGSGTQLNNRDPLDPPLPGFNTDQSLLYFYYSYFAWMVGDPAMDIEGYSAISIGPDRKDSFIVYYPFPGSLPEQSAQFGIEDVQDTVYDPTNGAISNGDLAVFGGELTVKRLVGGGNR